MNKVFLKPPLDSIEKILFSIALAKGISGNLPSKEEIIQAFKNEGLELNDEISSKLIERFPELSL